MSISQNFPDEGPTLNLNFAGSRTLDPRITFTRTSSATYLGDNGLVKIAAANSPRFDHRYNSATGEVESLGLLVEESRSNLVTYSEQFNDASWIKTNIGITTNTSATTAPDGSNNAEKLSATAVNGEHIAYKSPSLSSSTYTLSVFAKSAGYNFIGVRVDDGPASTQRIALFDLSTGGVGFTANITSSSITPYPNGWYRCSITATGNVTSFVFSTFPTNSNTTYTGDGTSGLFIWGAQVEQGSFPTSYIPTVASTVTRSADNATITGTNFSNFYNPTEGTIVAEGIEYPFISSSSRSFYNMRSSGDASNFIRKWIWVGNTNLVLNSVYTTNSGPLAAEFSSTITIGKKKTAFAMKVNDFAKSYNGQSIASDNSGNMPVSIDMMDIGSASNAIHLNGTVAQILYYPRRLTNTQLQNLTK